MFQTEYPFLLWRISPLLESGGLILQVNPEAGDSSTEDKNHPSYSHLKMFLFTLALDTQPWDVPLLIVRTQGLRNASRSQETEATDRHYFLVYCVVFAFFHIIIL